MCGECEVNFRSASAAVLVREAERESFAAGDPISWLRRLQSEQGTGGALEVVFGPTGRQRSSACISSLLQVLRKGTLLSTS